MARWTGRLMRWTPPRMSTLEDFILFDVSKPTSDTSYLEIEKSTLRGQPYQTGGAAPLTRTSSTS